MMELLSIASHRRIQNAVDARTVLRDLLGDRPAALYGVVLLNLKRQVLGVAVIAAGMPATYLHPRDVFAAAERGHAHSAIFFKYVSTPDAVPSPEDYHLAGKIAQLQQFKNLTIDDYMVISRNSCNSLAGWKQNLH